MKQELNLHRISIVFIIVGLGIRLWIAWRPLSVIDNLLFPDDTYISMAIARNLALGHGMTFDRLSITNGFQPLYVFMLIPLFKAIPNDFALPIHISLTFQAIFSVCTAILLGQLVSHTINKVAGFFAITIWIFAPTAIHQGINGLETGIALFFVALAFTLHFHALFPNLSVTWRTVLVGISVGLAIFTRIDNIILLPLLILNLLWRYRKDKVVGFTQAIILGVSALIVLIPWLIISYQCCNSFIPESGKAVRLQALASFHDIPGQTATLVLYNTVLTMRILAKVPMQLDYPIFWGLAISSIVLWLWISYKRAISWYRPIKYLFNLDWIRHLWPIWAYAIGLIFAYNLYVMAYWFFVRYFYAVAWALTIPISALLASVLHYLTNRQSSKINSPQQNSETSKKDMRYKHISLSWNQALVLMIIVLFIWFLPGLNRFMFTSPTQGGYYNIAKWANEQFHGEVVIGSAQSGALTYFAHPGMMVINMDGVANPDAYDALYENQQIDYLRSQNLTYVVNWPINMNLLRDYGGESLEEVLEPMGVIEGIQTLDQTWYWYRLLPSLETSPDD